MISDLELAVMAARSYVDAPTWRGVSILTGDVRAVRYDLPTGEVVIAFPGTRMDLRDWVRDIDAVALHDFRLGWCHAGFLRGARSLEWQVRDAASTRNVAGRPRVVGDYRPLILTGHSLGGALAVLLSGILCHAGNPPDALVTFGAPRAGFPKLGRVLRAGVKRIAQYRYGNDPVPQVPLPWIMPYRHPSGLRRLGVHRFPCIEAHHMGNYVEALRALVDAAPLTA